jgi:GDP-mannose transporter
MGNKKEDQEYSSLAVNTSELGTSPTLVASRFVDFPPWMKTALPILCYCTASIMMTVVNKYVVSGDFNMVFLLLAVQVKSEKKGREGGFAYSTSAPKLACC